MVARSKATSIVELIARKRDGGKLEDDEIKSIVAGFTDGSVTDYQMTALAMAIYFRGMTFEETVALTLAMRDSGKVLDWRDIAEPKVGKHSTGGVGDKVSICLAPIVAACGVAVPKMSGRGLGHTGGTLDKLEAIPGFRVDLSIREVQAQLRSIGVALMGQTSDLAPADKRLYALRDVTATVESIPLITASILSKKLAEGVDGLVFDVKVGRGAFMKTLPEGRKLARCLVRVGRLAGKNVSALLTDMNSPIGNAIGNALETAEALEILHGRGPDDLREITLSLGAEILRTSRLAKSKRDAMLLQEAVIESGAALHKMRALVEAQGGDPRVVDAPDRLRTARYHTTVKAAQSGYVREIDPLELGLASVALGAGRTRAEDSIDPGAGIRLHVNRGDAVKRSGALATLYASKRSLVESIAQRVRGAFAISDAKPRQRRRIIETIRR